MDRVEGIVNRLRLIADLSSLIDSNKEALEALGQQNERLRIAYETVLSTPILPLPSLDLSTSSGGRSGESESSSGLPGSEAEEIPVPWWDEGDQIYRCPTCDWEFIDSQCQSNKCDYECEGIDTPGENPSRLVSTDHKFIRSSRRLVERGSTPPLEETGPGTLSIPPEYKHREQEYRQLLSRGATPLMCEVYNLEFTPESGITAWADDGLFEEFANEEMLKCDRWMISLGREIHLDPGDEDGAQFMIDLLEETMDFFQIPIAQDREHRWLNFESPDGFWITTPEVEFDDQMDEDIEYKPDRDWTDGQVVANTLKNRYDTSEDVEGIEEELAIMADDDSDGWDPNHPSNDEDEDISSGAESESNITF